MLQLVYKSHGKMRKVEFEDIGLVAYGKAWDFQTQLFTKTVDLKLANRKNPERVTETTDHFLFVDFEEGKHFRMSMRCMPCVLRI